MSLLTVKDRMEVNYTRSNNQSAKIIGNTFRIITFPSGRDTLLPFDSEPSLSKELVKGSLVARVFPSSSL